MSQQINLYYEETGKVGRDLTLSNMLLVVLLIASAVMVFYAYTYYQLDLLQQQIDVNNKSLEQQQARLKTMTAQPTGIAVEQELQQSEAEVVAQRRIVGELTSGALGNTSGYSDYMQAFAKQALGGLWLTGFVIEGDAAQMQISGATLTPELVPAYIMRLNQEKIMRGKTFASLQMHLPKVQEGKTEMKPYLEFILQSVATSEADKK